MGLLSLLTLETFMGKSGGQSLGTVVSKNVATVTYSATINNYVPLLNQSVVTYIINAPNYLQNGRFVVSSSYTDYGFQYFNYQAFAFSAANPYYWACNSHSSTTTVDGTSKTGEWLQIKIPVLLNMTSFTTCNVYNSASSILIAGSTDGVTWTTVFNIASTGLSSTNSATTFGTPVIFNLTGNSNFYNYFRFIVTSSGSQTNLAKVNFSGIIPSDSTIISGTTLVNNVTYNVYAFQPNLLQSINNSVAAYSLNYTLTSSTFPVYVMAVGGGGGGGSVGGGGGGAGGVVMKAITLPAGSDVININIGAGGCGAKVNNYPLSATLVDEYYSTPVLNQISSAAYNSSQGAYGCVLLNSNYTGPILQLRSPSDTTGTSLTNFYSDIYGNLTTGTGGTGTAVTAWSSNASYAYVSTWYDQSNVTTNNATQTVVGSQPVLDIANKIINFGYTGSSNVAFTVKSITGLLLWLDASDNASFTLSSTTVTQWNDKSGNGYNMTIGAGTPLLVNNVINGRPAVYSINSSNYLQNTTIPFPDPPYSIFTVVYNTAGNQQTRFLQGVVDAHLMMRTETNNTITIFNGSGGSWNGYVTSGTAYTTPVLVEQINTGSSSGGMSLFINGAQSGSSVSGTATGFAGLYLGMWTGYIAEVVIYKTSLTQTQQQQVEGYLAWKWGIQANLPSSHPYYASAPGISSGSSSGPITVDKLPNFAGMPALWGAYSAESWISATNTLPDLTSNGRNATTSGVTLGTASGNGATGTVTYLNGSTTSATITWPAGSVPSTFTVCSLTRYNGGTNGRIFDAAGGNWLHGHYNNNMVGVCYYEGWKTPTSTVSSVTNTQNWLICTGTNSSGISTPNNVIVNGVGIGNVNGGSGNYTLTIGNGNYKNENSTFQFSQLFIWDSALTVAQMLIVNNFMQNYLNTGSSVSIASYTSSSSSGGNLATFPKTITSGTLLMWFDANDSSTISYSGSNISQWNDKSGSSRHATPYLNNCTYNATGFNGKPAIYFSTSTLQAPLPINSFSGGATVITAYFCSGGSWGVPFTKSYGNIGDPFDIYQTARYISNYASGTAYNSTINVSNLSTPCLFGIAGNTAGWTEWVNGGTQTYTNTTVTGFNDVNSNLFFIGGRWDKVTNLTGYVAETLVYAGVLSTADRQKVEGYLAWKWGIQSSLQSTHPYYSAAPYTTGSATTISNTGYVTNYNANAFLNLPNSALPYNDSSFTYSTRLLNYSASTNAVLVGGGISGTNGAGMHLNLNCSDANKIGIDCYDNSITTSARVTASTINTVFGINGCMFWFDANDSACYTTSAGVVQTLVDKSGSGNNLARLPYATGTAVTSIITNSINSLPTLSLENAGFAASLTSPTSYTGSVFSWYMVFTYSVSTYNGGGRLVSLADANGADNVANGQFFANWQNNSGANFAAYRGYGNYSTIVTGLTVTLNTTYLICGYYDGSSQNIGVNGQITYNTTSTSGSGNFNISKLGIGIMPNGGSVVTGIKVGEVLMFKSSPTLLQRQDIEGYLATKWGLRGSLPAAHPYSTSYSAYSMTALASIMTLYNAGTLSANCTISASYTTGNPGNGTTISVNGSANTYAITGGTARTQLSTYNAIGASLAIASSGWTTQNYLNSQMYYLYVFNTPLNNQDRQIMEATIPTNNYSTLISYFKLDEAAAATTVIDSISGYNGTSQNSVSFGNLGIIGNSASFNGTNQWISVPYQVLNNLTFGTIMCWIYPKAIVNSTICAKQRDGQNTIAALMIGSYANTSGGLTTGSPGTVYFHSTNSQVVASSVSAVPINSWSHIAVTFNATQVNIYINGSLNSTTATNGSIPTETASTSCAIGAWYASSSIVSAFTGFIDDFSVWRSALSDRTIYKVYSSQFSSIPNSGTNTTVSFNALPASNITAFGGGAGGIGVAQFYPKSGGSGGGIGNFDGSGGINYTTYTGNFSNCILYFPFDQDILNYSTGTGVSVGSIVGTGCQITNSFLIVGSGCLQSANINTLTSYFKITTIAANLNGYTFCCWLYVSSATVGMVWSFSQNSNVGNRIYLYFNGTQLCIGTASGNVVFFTPTLYTWYHFAWTLDKSNNSLVYVNGSAVFSTTSYAYLSYVFDKNYILSDPYGTTYPGMYGYIDDFYYFDTVMTPANILFIYNTSSQNMINSANIGGSHSAGGYGAGGGGAGSAGTSSTSATSVPNGGNGIQLSLAPISAFSPFGTNYGTYYWGGGGGGGSQGNQSGGTSLNGGGGGFGGGGGGASAYSTSTYPGGSGGGNSISVGNAGNYNDGSAGNGGANTGGGGGGAWNGTGGNGGSGIVVIAVPVTISTFVPGVFQAGSSTIIPMNINSYSYTGYDQTLTVPSGVTYMTVQVWGAGGGIAGNGNVLTYRWGGGGSGGYTSASFNVTSGQTLKIIVGKGGIYGCVNYCVPGTYGGGGGANQANNDVNWGTASGGGRTAVQLLVSGSYTELITAGGGGAGGETQWNDSTASHCAGGAGGGTTGGNGYSDNGESGSGGTQSSGGAAAPTVQAGSNSAGSQYTGGYGTQYGGGGGGGWYGGGGGGSWAGHNWLMGGGGGGSSYINTAYQYSGSTNIITQGVQGIYNTLPAVANDSGLPTYVQGMIGYGGKATGQSGNDTLFYGGDGYALVTFYGTSSAGTTTALSSISITNFQLNDTTGSVTTNGNVYTAYVLKSTSVTYTISYTSAVATTIYLFAVGGGGGAGQGGGGGGGVFSDGIPVVAGTGTITITIGAGGAGVSGSNYAGVASAGGNTVVTFSGVAASKTVTAWGGGYGTNWGGTGGTGGSGGAGETAGAANNTGNIIGWKSGFMGFDYNGGGGGGAGGSGGNGGRTSGTLNTGFGGIGIRCLLPGLANYQLNSQNVSYWYWAGGGAGSGANSLPGGNGGLGGGGGGSCSVTSYSGGLGGGQAINSGGNGDNSDNPGSAGVNTGGGGGGSRNKVGGSGGSGIVMIALPTSIASFTTSVQKLTLTNTNYVTVTDHPYSNMVIINYQMADLVGTSTSNGITYMVCAFTTPNVAYTINYTCNESMPIQILAVGGGGGGSNWTGGGGGGGGVVMQYVTLPNGSNSINISVGAGGAGPTASNTLGNNGSNSTVIFNAQSASNITAYGGGRGAGGGSTVAALTGGSGGGSSIYNIGTGVAAAGNTASNNLANSGGTGVSVDSGTGIAGGGGGAGAAAVSKNGGNGIKCSMPGINAFSPYGVLYGNYFWAGGGGGCTASTNVNEGNGGAGGKGGGGGGNVAAITGKVIYGGLGDTNGINAGTNASNIDNGSPGNGGANTGGGGGGGWSPATGTGGSGGSGIVIIAFPNSFSVDWKPTNNPGLALWFDASDNSSIVQTGGKVSQWNDKSPNQYSIIQPNSGNQPTFVLNSLDNKPGVQLSNTSWLYQYGNAIGNYSGSLYSTAYIVIKNSAGLPSGGWNVLNTMWFNGINLGVSRYHLSLAQASTNGVTLYADYVNNGTSGYVGQVSAVASNSYAIIGFTVSPNATTISLNGTATTYGGLTLLNANNGNTMFNFGDFRQALFQTSNVIIYEFVGYNIPLSTSQSQAVEGYLAWKWNLQAALPSSHPYFNIFPSQTTWTPSLVSSTMLLWLDASDRTTVITSGSNVTQWSDKSGAGNHMTQGVAANQPVVSVAALNGLNVINFGVSSFMQNTGITVPRSYTIFGVGYTNATYSASNINNLYTRMISTISDAVLFFGAFDNINTDFTGNNTWNDVAFNSPYVNVDYWSIKGMTNTGSGTGQTSYVNGTPQIAKTGNNIATTGLYVGCFTNCQFWNGPMAEILIYNGVLSTNDRQAVEGYLAWKWGLQSYLPSGHPYQFLPINATSTVSNSITGTGSVIFPTTNLMFDFYAGNGCNVNSNGGALTIWNDQMKNIVATGNATFNKSVQNGLPMISGGVITTTSFGSGIMYNWTHFLVCNTGVTGNTTGELFIQNTVTNGIQTGISASGFYTAMFKNNGNAAISSNVTLIPNKTYILTISYSLSGTIEKYTYRTNSVITTPTVNSATAAYNYVNGTYIVTKSTTSGSAPSATGGYIGEQLLYNTTMSLTNIKSIENHLAYKWGVPIGGAYNYAPTITTTSSNVPATNLLFDFYAGSGSNVVTNGGTVTSWTDAVNGVVATGSGTFNTSLQNGLPMISSGVLTTPSIGSGNLDNWTHFVVYKFGTTTAAASGQGIFENNANNGIQIGINGNYSACYNHIAWAPISSTATFVANGIYILVISYSFSGSTGTYVYRTNGVDTTQSPGYATTSNRYVAGSYIVSLGSYSGTTPQANGGYIGEQILYNATLSLSQIQSIEQHLSWKWSIPIGSPAAVPASTPFYGSIITTTPVQKMIVPVCTPFTPTITTTLGQNTLINTFSLYISNSAYLTITTLANGANDLTVYGMSIGTVEVWVNFTQSTAFAGVVVKANYYGLYISNNKFAVYSWSSQGNTGATVAGNTLNDGAWHHLAFSFNSGVTNGSFMYVDGALVSTLTWYGNNNASNVFCVGSESANFQVYTGYVDELRIWNIQLTSSFINVNYNRKVVPSAQGLVGYFMFDTDTYVVGSISAGAIFSNIANKNITNLTAYGTGLSLSTTINTSLSNYYKTFTGLSNTKYGLPIGLTSNLVAFIDFSNTNSYSGSGTTFYNLVDKSAQQILGSGGYSYSNSMLTVNNAGSTQYLLLASYGVKTISIWLKLNGSSGYILDGRTVMPNGWMYQSGNGSNWIKSYKNGGNLVNNPQQADTYDTTGTLYNITMVADSVYTEQMILGARYSLNEGLNCSIAKILVFNTELSQADNTILYNTINSGSFNSNSNSAGTGTGTSANGPISLSNLPNFSGMPALWAAYSAESWVSATNVLPDLTINARNATTSGVTLGTASGNGATGSVAYLDGNTSSRIIWPAGSIPTTFTICSLTRYNGGGSNSRILNSSGGNWLHGHWGGQAGVCHYDGWRTPSSTVSSVSNVLNWTICTGTNSSSVSTPNNVIVNGVGVGNANGGGVGNGILTINPFEQSTFQFSQLFIWDSALTAAQMLVANNFMQNYLNTGSSVSIASYGAGILGANVLSNIYPSSLGCIFRIKSFTSTVPTADVDNVFSLNNTGTVTCVPDPLNVRSGYVFQFNGSNYLSISVNTPAFSTKTFWVYTTTPSSGAGNVFSSTNYPVNFKSTNYLSALPNFLTVANNNPSSVSQPASWTFYAVTSTASAVNIYMNGSSIPVATNSLTNFVGDTTDIQFGAYTAGSYYTGYLDDMRLYPTVLTADQIYAIFIGDVSVLNNISSNAYSSSNCIYGTHLLNANYTGPAIQLRLPTDTTGVGATDFFADIYGNLNTGPNNTGMSLSTWATPSSFLNNDSTLLMYYPFNSNLFNIVSGSVDATFVNGGYISNNDYKVGYGSCQFVGYQQYVNSTASFTTGTNGVSFSFWFRSNNSPTYARLFNFSTSYRNNTIFMGISNANQLGCSVYNGTSVGDVWNPGTTTVNDNVWRHCLWTINNSASNNSTIYLNGVASATFTVNYPQSVARSVNYFGYNEFGNGLLNGAIDDFRVYNRAVNPNTAYIQEVSLQYNYNSYKYAYVTKWYDQSNLQANTAYQTSVGYQPIFDIENNVINYGYSGSTGCGLGYVGNYNSNAYLNLPNNALPYNDSSYTYTTRLLNSNNTSNAVIVSGGNSTAAGGLHMLYNYPYYNQDWFGNGNLGSLPLAAFNNIPVTFRYLTTGNTATNYLYVTANNSTASVLPAIARSQTNNNNTIGTNNTSGWGTQYWTALNSQMYYLYALSLNMVDNDRYVLENTVNLNPVNTPYLLNNMSNSGYNSCQGAYACLLVNTQYKGPIMQLRSPSDTAGTNLVDFYSDIYGNLTTSPNGQGTAVSNWSSNINYAYVGKWYDQSNVTTNHATQTVTSSQPVYDIANRIINFGYTGSGSGAFSVASIPGLILWLDANDPNNNGTQPANNASVTSWKDKSGLGNNGSASSGVTYTTNGLNSKPAMYYNNGNQNSVSYYFSGNVTNNNPTMSVFAVISMSSASLPSARIIGFSGGSTVNDYQSTSYFGFLRQSGTGMGPYRAGTYVGNNTYTSYSTPYVYGAWFDGTNEYTNVQVGNNTTIGSAASSGNFAITYYSIGNNPSPDANGPFTGYVSEILVYNTCLTQAQRQQVEGYLSWKWGLQTNLPTAHPYYSAAPSGSGGGGTGSYTTFPKTATSSTLIAWYDGNDPNNNSASIPANSAQISTWYDKSGLGNNLTQTNSGNQPTYSTNVQNSLNAVFMNGSQFMLNTTVAFPAGNYSVFAICKLTTNNGSWSRLINGTVGDSNLLYGTNNGYDVDGFSNGSGWMDLTTTKINSVDQNVNNIWYLKEIINSGSSTGWQPLINGTLCDVRSASGTTAFTGLELGGYSSGANQPWIGYAGEILIYNTALSTGDRQKVEGYLAWKWGIQTSLPASHPYYTSSPYSSTTTATNYGYTTNYNANAYLNLPNATIPYNDSSYSVVLRHWNIPTNGNFGFLNGGLNNSNANCLCIRTNSNAYFEYWGNYNMSVTKTIIPGNVISTTYVSGSSSQPFYVNSTLITTGTMASPRTQASTSNFIGVTNTSTTSPGSEYLNGQLYYLCIFNTSLSNSDRNLIENIGYFPTNPNKMSVIVNNYNFAYPVQTTNLNTYYSASLPGWKIGGSGGFVIANGTAWTFNSNANFTQFFISQSPVNGYISQNVYLNAGTTYVMTFYGSSRPNTFASNISVWITLNGYQIFTQIFTSATNTWILYTSTPFVMNYNGYYNLAINFNAASTGDTSVGISNVSINATNVPKVTTATATTTSSAITVTVSGTNLAFFQWKNNTTNTTNFVTCSNNGGSFTDNTSIAGGTGYTYTITPLNSISITGSNFTTSTFTTLSAYYNGLVFTIYNSYKNNDTSASGWTVYDRGNLYNSATTTGRSSNLTNIGWGTNGSMIGNWGANSYWNGIAFNGDRHDFTIVWYGFFYTQSYGGNWTFGCNSDDASFLWIGTNAVAPNYTGGRSTATVDDGDPHGMSARSTQVSLTANTYYPFRVQFGEAGGGYESVITVTRPDGTSFTDGTGYYFSQ